MTPAERSRARVKMSDYVWDDAKKLAEEHGIGLYKQRQTFYVELIGHSDAPDNWSIRVYPLTQRIVTDWGTPPTLDLPAEWNILSVILRVVEALERKDEA
jgi:hypothetical protein